MSLAKLKPHHTGLLLLLLLSSTLRFVNLGYSEFQDDEKKTQIRLQKGENWIDFFMRQRKGPMQFLVAQIPFSIYDPKIEVNEIAVRLPFTIANLVSVFVLYALILKIAKSHLASFITSSAYSFNGFVVGFSRIAQYQNLNLLFSLLSLYFLATMNDAKRGLKTRSFLAGLFMSLSILSHWDAVFYSIPTLYLLYSFIRRKDVSRKNKLKSLLPFVLTLCLIVLPFMYFYLPNLGSNQSGNLDYLFRRVGVKGSELSRHLYIFKLYNPTTTLWLYLAGILVSAFFIRKTHFLITWFIFNFLVIKFFMVTPKTHIYNYVIPLLIVGLLGFYHLFVKLREKGKWITNIFISTISISLGLLFIQSFQMFVDHRREYPFDEKRILWHLNTVLKDKETITFGFPHKRGWKNINKVIKPECKYITNENKSISQIYVKASYGAGEGCLYLVVVKRPFYTETQNAVYAEAKPSKLVYEWRKDGEVLSQVYKIK